MEEIKQVLKVVEFLFSHTPIIVITAVLFTWIVMWLWSHSKRKHLRCQIVELEQENKELKLAVLSQKAEQRDALQDMTEAHSHYRVQITELEKQRAELQDQNRNLQIALRAMENQPGRQSQLRAQVLERSLSIVRMECPGVAPTLEAAIERAEQELHSAETGQTPHRWGQFVRRLWGNPAKQQPQLPEASSGPLPTSAPIDDTQDIQKPGEGKQP